MIYLLTDPIVLNPTSSNARLSGPAMWHYPNADSSIPIMLAVSKLDNLGRKRHYPSFRAVKSNQTYHRSVNIFHPRWVLNNRYANPALVMKKLH